MQERHCKPFCATTAKLIILHLLLIILQKLKMIVLLELNGNLTIYSGTSYVGKLHIPNISTNTFGNSKVLSIFYGQELLSPYPRRSSLISPCKFPTPDVKFDEGVHLLSPVGGTSTNSNMIENSLLDGSFMCLKAAISNKLILQYGDSSQFQVILPTLKASPIGMYLKFIIMIEYNVGNGTQSTRKLTLYHT